VRVFRVERRHCQNLPGFTSPRRNIFAADGHKTVVHHGGHPSASRTRRLSYVRASDSRSDRRSPPPPVSAMVFPAIIELAENNFNELSHVLVHRFPGLLCRQFRSRRRVGGLFPISALAPTVSCSFSLQHSPTLYHSFWASIVEFCLNTS
jgi:hypothetical protein